MSEFMRGYHHSVHLLRIQRVADGAYHYFRWTDSDQPIRFGGFWYEANGIRFDQAQYSADIKLDSIQLEIQNVDKAFSDLVLSNDMRGNEVRIYRVALDNYLNVIGGMTTETDLNTYGLLFVGYMDKIEVDRGRAKIEVYNHFIKWKMPTPRRIHSPTCYWVFASPHGITGSTECGWTGYALGYDTGTGAAVVVGDTITGLTTGHTALVEYVELLTGTWGVDAAGNFYFHTSTGTFQNNEQLRVGGVTRCLANGIRTDSTWCDHSYNRCLALANTNNFGGFRFLPDLASKELTWGSNKMNWKWR